MLNGGLYKLFRSYIALPNLITNYRTKQAYGESKPLFIQKLLRAYGFTLLIQAFKVLWHENAKGLYSW